MLSVQFTINHDKLKHTVKDIPEVSKEQKSVFYFEHGIKSFVSLEISSSATDL